MLTYEALTAYIKLVSAVHALYWDSLPSNPATLISDYLKSLSLCDNAIHGRSFNGRSFMF
jgi:hypothetical protein